MGRFHFGVLNRSLCDVLDEMRKLHENRNFSYLLSLIDEAQSMGNRMEAKLTDIKDIEQWELEKIQLKQQIKELELKKAKLKEEVGEK